MGSKKHEKTGAKRNITLKHLFFILSVSSSSIDKDYAADLEVGRQSHRGLQRNDCLRPMHSLKMEVRSCRLFARISGQCNDVTGSYSIACFHFEFI